jgi:hypothetical protein
MNQMTKLDKLCIKWLNENYNHMEPFIMKEYPDYIFHMKDGRCILQHNKKSGYVYVSYREIWSFFEHMFSMSNQQIKDITKIWVEEHYKMGNVSTKKCIITDGELLSEKRYKEITATKGEVFWMDIKVEEHYKMGVTTQIRGDNNTVQTDQQRRQAEKHYQKIQTTNNQNEFYFDRDVEELYNQYTDG